MLRVLQALRLQLLAPQVRQVPLALRARPVLHLRSLAPPVLRGQPGQQAQQVQQALHLRSLVLLVRQVQLDQRGQQAQLARQVPQALRQLVPSPKLATP